MYFGAGLWVLGLAVFYQSPGLLLYAVVFMVIAHAFVLLYEEPRCSGCSATSIASTAGG